MSEQEKKEEEKNQKTEQVRRNEAVAAQAITLSALRSTPVFLKRGRLIVNGKHLNAFVGDINENAVPLVDIFGAIQVGEWIFTAEQSKVIPQNGFFIGGFFFGSSPAVHATFCQADVTATQSPQQALLNFVSTKIWPILHPEEFVEQLEEKKATKDDITVSWSIEQLTE